LQQELNKTDLTLGTSSISGKTGISEGEMSKILTNCHLAEWKDFTPFLYNIWNSSKTLK